MGHGQPGASARPQPGAGAGSVAAGAGTKERAGALIVDRNRNMAKRLARVLVSAGYTVKTYEDEAAPLGHVIQSDPEVGLWLLLGEAAASRAITTALQATPGRRVYGVCYANADELDVAALCEQPGLVALLGQRGSSGRAELESELLGVAAHLRGQPLLPMQAYLLWGSQAFSTSITNIGGRDAAEARIVKLCRENLNCSGRIADTIGEVVHELITNAMYDAPVDEYGRPRYAHDRTAPIELVQEDRVTFRYGTDGLRLVVETSDRFGRLRRLDFAKSLRRAQTGQVNRGEGGAGIGLSMICRSASTVQVDVEPGLRTRVTAVLELDPSRPAASAASPEASRPGRSLIFPDLAARLDGGHGSARS